MSNKKSYKDFGKMTAEFGSNWKKIKAAKKAKEAAFKKALSGN
tara:strand:- start:745 stop:873 length:129 start_codon:yes stop_codon:yes gene_type:complete